MRSPTLNTLPTGYLLANFKRVLCWVSDLYDDLLTPEEKHFQQRFSRLDQSAQSLLVRLHTRKLTLIPIHSLQYDDVICTHTGLIALQQQGFVERNPPCPPDLLLETVRKADLSQLFPLPLPSGTRKADWIAAIAEHYPGDYIQQQIAEFQPFIRILNADIFATYLLLFFGNGRQDLSEFVITDLGHVRYESYAICRQTRYFNMRDEVEILQTYLQARELLESSSELQQDPAALTELHQHLPLRPHHPELWRRYQRITLTIARQLERLQQPELALALYHKCEQHPSLERQARIWVKLNQPATALDICRKIAATSRHPEELEFAATFGKRLAQKQQQPFKAVTAPPIASFQLLLTNTGESVERIAAAALTDADHHCVYVENLLFCGLFGLTFWDIVFAPVPGAFFNPFQRGPKHLHSEYFYADRAELIDHRLNTMATTEWHQYVWQHFNAKQGIANGFVVWEALDANLLERALHTIPAQHLQRIFHQIAAHPGFYSSGFPDLIRFSKDHYELIEVKGPGDRLQPNQQRWFKLFQQSDIPARLLNVTWAPTIHDR